MVSPKMFARRVMIVLAVIGFGAAASGVSYAVAGGAYYVGSIVGGH